MFTFINIYFLLHCFSSTIFWFKYGFILGDMPMSLVNGFGMILAIYSGLIYHRHTSHRVSCEIMAILGLCGVLGWLMCISAGIIKLDGVGFSAMCASIVMFASPLVALWAILRHHFSLNEDDPMFRPHLLNRNKVSIWIPREGLSLGMIGISLAVSLSWLTYGLVISDKFVLIPNAMGAVLSVIQFAVWSFSYPTESSFSTADDLSSNSSSLCESQNALLPNLKRHTPLLFRDPLTRPNTVVPIEMKRF